MRAGSTWSGGKGSSFLPQAPKTQGIKRRGASRPTLFEVKPVLAEPSEYKSAQVAVAHEPGESSFDVRRVHDHARTRRVRPGEGDLLQDRLQDRVEAPCADVLEVAVHLGGGLGDLGQAVLGEDE